MFHYPLLAASAAATPPTISAVALPSPAPPQTISAADVAAYIDPGDVARFQPPPLPNTELVAISGDIVNLLENATMVVFFVFGVFLLARLLHAWMLHRSIRRALDAKSDHLGAMIDKLNKPYEHIGGRSAPDTPSDDRNGLVLIAIGLAIAGFGLIQGHEQLIRTALGAALFPTFVGVALLVRRRMARAAAAAAGEHTTA